MSRVQVLVSEKEVVKVVIAYVFREHGLKEIAEQWGVSDSTVQRRLVDFGVSIRDTHEQRRCDRERGRYSQADAIRAAWRRGAYDSDTFRSTRHYWYSYERHGEKNPFFGRRHSAKTRHELAEQARARSLPGTGQYGEIGPPSYASGF